MKKLLLICLFIVGCTSVIETLFGTITMSAKQTFIDAGGNAVSVVEQNAVAPVTVQVTVDKDLEGVPIGTIGYQIGTQCTAHWDVTQVGNFDNFWLGVGAGSPQTFTVTYDASKPQCVPRQCTSVEAQMDTVTPTTAIVTMSCSAL